MPSLKIRIAKKIPTKMLDNLLLTFPFLYRTNFINFESYLDGDGMKDLIKGLNVTKSLPGNIIECGCARCGTSVVLARYLKSNQISKKIYALDSFKGFDPKELECEKKQGLTCSNSADYTQFI